MFLLTSRRHPPYILFLALPFKDAFGLKPVDVVADLDTTELVKRALTPGRFSGSVSQGTPPRSSRPSLARTVSPSPDPATQASAIRADTAGRGEKLGASSSTPPLRSPHLSASLVAFESSSAAGERGLEGGSAPVKAVSVAGVDAPHRGSWSRPIGPRPQPSRAGSGDSGGGGGVAKNGEGGGNGSVDRSRVSVKTGGRPSSRSQRQVAVLETESPAGSDAHPSREPIANGSEVDVLVEGRRSAEHSEGSEVKNRRQIGGSSGDGAAPESSRNLCGSPGEDVGVVHPRKHDVLRASD